MLFYVLNAATGLLRASLERFQETNRRFARAVY